MQDNPNTENLSLDTEDWAIAFEPYAGHPDSCNPILPRKPSHGNANRFQFQAATSAIDMFCDRLRFKPRHTADNFRH